MGIVDRLNCSWLEADIDIPKHWILQQRSTLMDQRSFHKCRGELGVCFRGVKLRDGDGSSSGTDCLRCAAQPTELARPFTLRLTSAMKGRAVIVLLGLGTLGAYALGYHSAPISQAPVGAMASPSGFAQPVAFSGAAAQLPAST